MKMLENQKNQLLRKYHVTMTKKVAYKWNNLQLQNHSSTINLKKTSLPSATNVASPQPKPKASDTTASMDKLTCPDYVDFGKIQDRFGQFSWSKNDSNYMDKKSQSFRKR